MTFDDFSRKVQAAGLLPKDCGDGHWQIRGGKYIVNFYPFALKGPSMFVNGMHRGKRYDVTIEDALRATKTPPRPSGEKAGRWGLNRRARRYRRELRHSLFARDPHCFWCQTTLTLLGDSDNRATLDHLIPISKGGSNSEDNQVLACYACNQDRKNTLPAKTKWDKREATAP